MLWKGLFLKLNKNYSKTYQLCKIGQTSAVGDCIYIYLSLYLVVKLLLSYYDIAWKAQNKTRIHFAGHCKRYKNPYSFNKVVGCGKKILRGEISICFLQNGSGQMMVSQWY